LFFASDNDRFHGIPENPYLWPSDADESHRLDATHYVVKFLYRRNVLVPVSKKATLILDVGTGSGSCPSKFVLKRQRSLGY